MTLLSSASRRQALGLLGAGIAAPALAQFRVEVSGVGLTQVPIVVAPLRGEARERCGGDECPHAQLPWPEEHRTYHEVPHRVSLRSRKHL